MAILLYAALARASTGAHLQNVRIDEPDAGIRPASPREPACGGLERRRVCAAEISRTGDNSSGRALLLLLLARCSTGDTIILHDRCLAGIPSVVTSGTARGWSPGGGCERRAGA